MKSNSGRASRSRISGKLVRNEKKADHFFHWTQHITLGLPFLAPDEAQVSIPGTRGITYPHGYDEGRALLTSNEEFSWPNAPLLEGGKVDLRRPFLRQGLGFVVAVLLDKKKSVGFVAAVNPKLGLLDCVLFQAKRFPLGCHLGRKHGYRCSSMEAADSRSWTRVQYHTASRVAP